MEAQLRKFLVPVVNLFSLNNLVWGREDARTRPIQVSVAIAVTVEVDYIHVVFAGLHVIHRNITTLTPRIRIKNRSVGSEVESRTVITA